MKRRWVRIEEHPSLPIHDPNGLFTPECCSNISERVIQTNLAELESVGKTFMEYVLDKQT